MFIFSTQRFASKWLHQVIMNQTEKFSPYILFLRLVTMEIICDICFWRCYFVFRKKFGVALRILVREQDP